VNGIKFLEVLKESKASTLISLFSWFGMRFRLFCERVNVEMMLNSSLAVDISVMYYENYSNWAMN
jgi:hypothetical protein